MVNTEYDEFIDKFNNEIVPLYESKPYNKAMLLEDTSYAKKAYNEIGLDGLNHIIELITNSHIDYLPYGAMSFSFFCNFCELNNPDDESRIVRVFKESVSSAKLLSEMNDNEYNLFVNVLKNKTKDKNAYYVPIIKFIKYFNSDSNANIYNVSNIVNILNILSGLGIEDLDNCIDWSFENNIMIPLLSQIDVSTYFFRNYVYMNHSINHDYRTADVAKKLFSYSNPDNLDISGSSIRLLSSILENDSKAVLIDNAKPVVYSNYVFHDVCDFVNEGSNESLKIAYYMAKIAVYMRDYDAYDNTTLDKIAALVKGIHDGYPDEYLIEVAKTEY